MQVEIITTTGWPIDAMWIAAKNCTSEKSCIELDKEARVPLYKDKVEFINKVLGYGHTSIAEHFTFTVAISGISRACSHQLVRHRLASYAQKSQRYVNSSNFEYIAPSSITSSPELLKIYMETMSLLSDFYKKMIKSGVKKEDARMILPNATCTDIVMTMNLREFMNFYELRACGKAQWEIRLLAQQLYNLLMDCFPKLIESCVKRKCDKLGYCPEAKSCGYFKKTIDKTKE